MRPNNRFWRRPAEAGATDLVKQLQAICSDVIDAYSATLKRLRPIKNTFADHAQLAQELQTFADDAAGRAAFKPDKLCGRVEELLTDLADNLDPLKYSLDVSRLREIRQDLGQIGQLDRQWYQSYDELTNAFDQLARGIREGIKEHDPQRVEAEANQAKARIMTFEDELRTGIAEVHDAKERIVLGKTYGGD